MKYLVLISVFLFSFAFAVKAQHCPFDGGHLIAVHLIDTEGKPVSTAENLTLVEINNPSPQSCTYAEGLLNKSFAPTKASLQDRYQNHWEYWIAPRTTDWMMFNPGYFAVVLNMAEETCMIKKDNDFTYRDREFEIQYQDRGKTRKAKVASDKIYSLCTSAGKWTRIQPIELKSN